MLLPDAPADSYTFHRDPSTNQTSEMCIRDSFNTLAATPDNFTIFASDYDDAFLGSSNSFKANGLSAMFAGDLTPEQAAENIQAAYEEQAASYQ